MDRQYFLGSLKLFFMVLRPREALEAVLGILTSADDVQYQLYLLS